MNSTLDERIDALVKEIASVSLDRKRFQIKRFIEEELAHREQAYTITANDLANIYSYACDVAINTPASAKVGNAEIVKSTTTLQAYSYTRAVYMWMRSKDLTKFLVSFEEK